MPETERTLITYVDSRIQQLDSSMNRRLDKQDTMLEAQDVKLDLLLGFKPTAEARLATVEREIEGLRRRPLQTWQIVAGVIGVVIMLCSLGTSVTSMLVSIWLHSLH